MGDEEKNCPCCEAREAEEKSSEEASLGVLIALVPLMVVTLLNNMGAL